NFEHAGKVLINASIIDLVDVTKDFTPTGSDLNGR
ncbi:MAG: DUF3553 domain-containing protein, partial [Alphaproteobacteria bacterium]